MLSRNFQQRSFLLALPVLVLSGARAALTGAGAMTAPATVGGSGVVVVVVVICWVPQVRSKSSQK